MEAPISASQGAMRSVLSKLNLLLGPEYRRLRKGQKNKIRLLQEDLKDLMSNYFIEPSDVEAPALTAECWVKQLRELSYDIDDFLDKLLYDDADAKIARLRKNPKPRTFAIKTCRFKIARLRKYLNPRRRITDEISEFRSRVEEAIQQHWIYDLDDRPLYHGVETSPLVDIDRPKKKLHEWLTNDEEKKLMVVSIVGSGGVGKTTLANELYKLGGRFECRAYVRTSRKPDLRRLLTSMLSQIRRHQRVEASGVHDLIDNIRQHLQDKRYFVIIDDLWALSTWDIVSRALPDSNRCSRILITTEIDVVAQACCGYNSKYIFKMEPLSEDGSRELFFNRVFGRQHKCPEILNEVSYEIIRKCGGLPLATLTISSLLAHPPCGNMEQHWNYVQNSLSYNMRTDPTLEGMKQVLNLSYNNLPHRLKACMLYLSLYPEDYIICKDDLVKQWIAEGFIEGKYMEEVARSYFDELINRGMIQPVYINYNGDVLSCTVHYMILNLIRYKSIEENFIIAIDHSQTTIRLADKVRRLALHFGSVEDVKPPANMRLSQVRSLAFYGLFKCMPSIIEFKLLRVLFLKLWVDPDDMIYDLTEISALFRLTYLHIDACLLRIELPAQMQWLKGLVTLKIAARVSAIPSDIVHLPGLLHLSLPSGTNLPNGICHMTSLRTLGYFDLSSNSVDNVEGLSKLTNLRDLQLTCSTELSDNLESNMQRLSSILGKLSNLESLTLLPVGSSHVNILDDPGTSSMSISCDGSSTVSPPLALLQRIELLPRYCIFSNLPGWIGELNKLCILKIAVRKLSMADIAVLKGLPALTTLSLYVQTAPVERIVFDKAGLSVLKYFQFRCSVPWLRFDADAMPNLWKLKLGFNAHGVDQHGTILISIEHLSSVKEITAKIGGAGADAESALASAVSNHPNNPRINVQLVDWIFYGDKGNNMVNIFKYGEILEEDPDEYYKTADEDSEEDENKQSDIRISRLLESSSCLLVPENMTKSCKSSEKHSTASAWRVAGVGWSVTVLGWFLSSIIGLPLNKFLSFLGFDASQKLRELEIHTIPKLKKTLSEVEEQRILGEARKERSDVNILDELASMLKSALYEAEDILDLIDYHQIEKKVVGVTSYQDDGIPVDSFLPTIASWNLKKRIERLENTVMEVKKSDLLNQERSSALKIIANMNRRGIRATAERKVFGRDKERDMITKMLREGADDYAPSSSSGECYSAIGIYGIAGSGKTALAEYVRDYEKEAKDKHFDPIMCIHVSETFRVDDIFRDMLEEITQDRHSNINGVKALKAKLMEELRGRRFLLVLDEIWVKDENYQELEELLSPLNVGRRGSKILVTARTENAVRALGAKKPIAISDLDEDQYFKMFMHYADMNDRKYEHVGRKIAKKLRRSPIAAVTVAERLRGITNINQWESTAELDQLNETMGALWWSYQQLDADVRRCFEYCTIFPRRYVLERDELVRMWIAQGFVKTNNATDDMEDVGHRYCDELLSCSFLQLRSAATKYFTIHDLLRDLVEKVAGSDCFRIEKGWTGEVPREVRHLFVTTCDRALLAEKILKLENLRTLIIGSGAMKEEIEDEDLESMFTKLRKLRILSVRVGRQSSQFTVPASIGQLKHIRYLAIKTGYYFKIILPRTFSKLYHMQVLDFGSCSELVFYPGQDMSNLINLRQILTLSDLNLPNIIRLTSLQTLPIFQVRKEPGYELRQLRDLNKLRGWLWIRGLENVGSKEEALEANLAAKERITELTLQLAWDRNSCSADLQAEILEVLRPPMGLEKLQIKGYKGSRYPDWMVGNKDGPKHLQELVLSECSQLGAITHFFVHLHELTIWDCRWDALPDNMEHLTSLNKLIIHGCWYIRSLPTLPQSLERLRISRCNDVFTRSCKIIGDPNWQKIEHVPKKEIES